MAKINLGKVVPEKGVDYFTSAEIAEFKATVEADIDTRLTGDEANITTNANNISDNTSAISALGTRMTTAEGNISTNAGNITSIGNRVTTLESDMTTAKSNIQTNAGDIDTIEQQQTLQDNAIAANTAALEPLANIPTRVTALETNDTAQDTKIANLEAENASLRHDLNNATLDATAEPSDNITLQDTIEARLKSFSLEGKTEQDSTTGANKFDLKDLASIDTSYTKYGNGYTFTSNDTMYYNGVSLDSPINLPISFSYKVKNGTGTNIRLKFWYDNGDISNLWTYGSGTGTSEVEITANNITSNDATKIIKIGIDYSQSGIFSIKDFIINEGSTATDYEPYTRRNTKS